MTDYDLTPGTIHRGLGFIARWPGIVLVIPSDPVHDRAAEELLAALGPEPAPTEVAQVVHEALHNGQLRTAGYLAMAAGGPLAMVSGAIEILSDGVQQFSGTAGLVKQQVNATDRLTMRATNLTKATEPVPPYDLRRGIAPGAGITLGSLQTRRDRPVTPPRPDQVRNEPSVREPQPAPDPVAVPFRSLTLFDQTGPVTHRPALPVARPALAADDVPNRSGARDLAPAEAPGSGNQVAMVHGILCSRAHFNNPGAQFCIACGIAMVHVTHNLVPGPRPTLGMIVFDDGSTFGLDRSYLIGREPHTAPNADPAPLTIQDNETLSRRHAEIRLVDWSVHLIDLESTNGSFIWDPDSERWNQLTPHQPVVLDPGATVALGRRTFVFESVTQQ